MSHLSHEMDLEKMGLEKVSGGGPGGPMPAQSISPETTLNALFSTRICDTIRQTLPCFVGLLKCRELEGVVGELQKIVVYRSCTL
jgi:hypothetical protein